ncbi:hypothetical protein [Pseudomonas koreensis]|uniref:hypothetical protein n=1 Tax=Pseudomonas koreensis TaxID=198620 RepID=UPI003F824CB8
MTDNTLSLLVQAPELREKIHFDTLLTQAQQLLDAHARRSWDDREEHDPGMTLLQTMMYGVSDLSYRHTLPLPDLLTAASENGPFSEEFSRSMVLRRDPLTEDDYRHAILNLRPTATEGCTFYFHNARLVPNTANLAPTYWIEGEDYRYEHKVGAVSSQRVMQSGTYTLKLELSAQGNREDAKWAIQNFLAHHRNLCESVSSIEWIEPQQVNIAMKLVLTPRADVQAPRIMAQIWQLAQASIRPAAKRMTAEYDEVNLEGFKNDLWQAHSGITQLPPKRDYSKAEHIEISSLISQIKRLDGIAKIECMEFDGVGNRENFSRWEQRIEPDYYPQLWQDNLATMLGSIVLTLNGQKVNPSLEAIKRELAQMAAQPATLEPEVDRLGRFRNPGRAIQIGQRLPACYGMQDVALNKTALQLRDFLLPFERELGIGTRRLAQLPQLLSFNKRADSLDLPEDEAAWVEHLLSYFDAPALELVDSTHQALMARRGLLKQINQISAARGTGVSADAPVTTLQRRIAARLGLGAELFEEDPNLGRLPFYVVEHNAIIPKKPLPMLFNSQLPLSNEINFYSKKVRIFSEAPFSAGNVVDLKFTSAQESSILGDVHCAPIVAADESSYVIDLLEAARQNPHLNGRETELFYAFESFKVMVNASPVWMKASAYRVKSAHWVDNGCQCFNLDARQYPLIDFQMNMKIRLGYHTGKEAIAWNYKGSVSSIDEATGTIVVNVLDELDASLNLQRLYWQPEISSGIDKLSLSLSLVFPESLASGLSDSQRLERKTLIERIVREEVPAHLSSYIHWFEQDDFTALSHEYEQWAGSPSLPSYLLLSRLGLGRSPGNLEGIGYAHVANDIGDTTPEVLKVSPQE